MIPIISSTILATVTFLLLLIPGFVFLRFFWGSDKGVLQNSNIYNHVIWGMLCSILLFVGFPHATDWLGISDWYNDFKPDDLWDSFFSPKSSITTITEKDGSVVKNIETTGLSLTTNIFPTVRIFLSLVVFAFITGVVCSASVFGLRLDIPDNSVLRFRNGWLYVLTARRKKELWFRKMPWKWNWKSLWNREYRPLGYYVEAHILCEINNHTIIYAGNVLTYQLNNDNSLEYIHLTKILRTLPPSTNPTSFNMKLKGDLNAGLVGELNQKISRKNPFDDEKNIVIDLYHIPADIMSFKFSDIKNISVKYIEIPKKR